MGGRHRRWVILAAIMLAALAFRLYGLTWGLHDANVSRRAHPDEWVVYWVFRWFSRHSLNPCPTPQTQCFFDWGGTYLYLSYAIHQALTPLWHLLPATTFGPRADPEYVRDVLAGRLTSALLSTLTVPVIYRLARDAAGEIAGYLAALLVALAALLIQLGHFATPDSTTIFFLSLSLLAMNIALRRPDGLHFAYAGAACGAAAGTEYHMLLLAIPLVVTWYLSAAPRGALLGAAGAAAAVWVVTNPYAVIEAGAFLDAGLHSLRLRTVESGAQYQGRWDAYGPALLYVVRYPLGYGIGFAVTAWMLLGVLRSLLRRTRFDLLLLSWIGPYFLLVTISPAKFMRYSAPLIPALAVLAALLAVEAFSLRPRLFRLLATGLPAAALLYASLGDAAYAQLFARPDARQVAAIWLQRHASPGTRIGFEEIPDGLVNLPYFVTGDGYQPCFTSFLAAHLRGQVRYLVLDRYAVEEHPAIPNGDVHAFLTALGDDPTYRPVFRVRYTPTILGLDFPVDASPHDWRYPAHDITIYAHLSPGTAGLGQCFPDLHAALAALYVPPPGAQG